MSLYIEDRPATAPDVVRKVHVGCGPRAHIAGWHNTDIRPFPGVHSVMDAVEPWPFTDLTHVFGEHFIEHLALDQALRFLVHAGNALAPGGRIRLSTPNLAWVMATCFDPAPPTLEQRIHDTIRVNRGFYGWGHQFLWSEEMLRWVMETVGYEQVSSHTYGESDDPELDALERHGGHSVDAGLSNVVILEGVRGARPPVVHAELDALFERMLLVQVRGGH